MIIEDRKQCSLKKRQKLKASQHYQDIVGDRSTSVRYSSDLKRHLVACWTGLLAAIRTLFVALIYYSPSLRA
jgi:hypothetical protein